MMKNRQKRGDISLFLTFTRYDYGEEPHYGTIFVSPREEDFRRETVIKPPSGREGDRASGGRSLRDLG